MYMYMHLLYLAHTRSTLTLSILRTGPHSILHLQSTCLDTLDLSKICQDQTDAHSCETLRVMIEFETEERLSALRFGHRLICVPL